ncbi:MAG TPA: tRNA (adenosine(37)-N6)-threonylcarbamoyltransferase complex dimerization subunit type 1 TsaB [Luteitalea sp.]|nr:tRNA (adenosine(37)-N6)-threonylcarbamoyltransferase complex dimerization subunit type 1 TsaB [Luteitalea sp.]
MLVLALDSSTRAGSVALARDGQVLDARVGDPDQRQAVRLPGDLTTLLTDHGLTLADVDLLAVTAGPGGFTGLRVGLATMQGLGLALGRPIFVTGTLDLLALVAGEAQSDVAWCGAWMRGMRGEIFSALHDRRALPPDAPTIAPSVGTPDECADAWMAAASTGEIAVAGDGWPDHADVLIARFGDRVRPCEAPPLASVLARVATARASEAVGPAAVRPAYVRRPDAVVLRQQAGLPVSGDL